MRVQEMCNNRKLSYLLTAVVHKRISVEVTAWTLIVASLFTCTPSIRYSNCEMSKWSWNSQLHICWS